MMLGRNSSLPPLQSSHKSAAARDMSVALSQKLPRFTAEGMHTSEMPMIRPMFAVTEPMALPTAMSYSPSTTPKSDTVSSGRVVHKLTIVAPTMNLGIPVTLAIHTAESTNQSPPLMIRTSPATNSRTTIAVSILLSLSPVIISIFRSLPHGSNG